jgi:tetratricopeptide (TPR) repeat protein
MDSSVQLEQLDLRSEVQQASVEMRENRLSEAMVRLQNVVAASPDDFTANHMLGVVFLKSERLPEAIARLWKATLLQPDHAGAHTHLGIAYAAADKTEKARSAYEAALKISPDYALAQTSLAKLPPPVSLKTAQAKTNMPTVTGLDASMTSTQVPAAPALPTVPATPAQKAGTKNSVRDFTTPDAARAINKAKDKSKSSPSFLNGVDWADVTLLGLGAIFLVLGLWLRFGAVVDGIRPYKTFGIIGIVIGISMLKAGMPGREHWRDDL